MENHSLFKQKYDYLSEKMRNLIDSDKDVLFVLYTKQSYSDFVRNFYEVMGEINCNCSLLILCTKKNIEPDVKLPPNIFLKRVSGRWKGSCINQKSWLTALNEFKFKETD